MPTNPTIPPHLDPEDIARIETDLRKNGEGIYYFRDEGTSYAFYSYRDVRCWNGVRSPQDACKAVNEQERKDDGLPGVAVWHEAALENLIEYARRNGMPPRVLTLQEQLAAALDEVSRLRGENQLLIDFAQSVNRQLNESRELIVAMYNQTRVGEGPFPPLTGAQMELLGMVLTDSTQTEVRDGTDDARA